MMTDEQTQRVINILGMIGWPKDVAAITTHLHVQRSGGVSTDGELRNMYRALPREQRKTVDRLLEGHFREWLEAKWDEMDMHMESLTWSFVGVNPLPPQTEIVVNEGHDDVLDLLLSAVERTLEQECE